VDVLHSWICEINSGTSTSVLIQIDHPHPVLRTTSHIEDRMPLPFLAEVLFKGMPFGIDGYNVLKVIVLVCLISLVKWYNNGAVNAAERQMHSKVVMITVCAFLHSTIVVYSITHADR